MNTSRQVQFDSFKLDSTEEMSVPRRRGVRYFAVLVGAAIALVALSSVALGHGPRSARLTAGAATVHAATGVQTTSETPPSLDAAGVLSAIQPVLTSTDGISFPENAVTNANAAESQSVQQFLSSHPGDSLVQNGSSSLAIAGYTSDHRAVRVSVAITPPGVNYPSAAQLYDNSHELTTGFDSTSGCKVWEQNNLSSAIISRTIAVQCAGDILAVTEQLATSSSASSLTPQDVVQLAVTSFK